MSIAVSRLPKGDYAAYDRFVEGCSAALVYHARPYLEALEGIVGAGEPVILAARTEDGIVGTIAAFILRTDHGVVLNSLPYFGSHGDMLIADRGVDKAQVVRVLIEALSELLAEERVDALNIVSHPRNTCTAKFAEGLGLRTWDHRVGQMSQLPDTRDRDQALQHVLASCHQKTRNLVRKGLRSNFTVTISDCDADWALMVDHHRIGMERIGGRAKSPAEFSALRTALHRHGMCRLYVARRSDEFAGALLLLFYRDWVEYFTPVAVDIFRNEQVLSALIATAMCEASVEGRRVWNWGGTWASQSGVYHFKKGWGAADYTYAYWGSVRNERLSKASPDALREQFPFFYVRPFN